MESELIERSRDWKPYFFSLSHDSDEYDLATTRDVNPMHRIAP